MPRPPHSQSATRTGASRSSLRSKTHNRSLVTRTIDSWFRWPAIWSLIVLAIVGTAFFISQAASATWSATPSNADWIPGGGETNWSTGVETFPGATSGTTNADTATFLTSSTTAITINSSSLNIRSITIGVSGSEPSTFTIGSIGGNPLLVSSGSTISVPSNTTAGSGHIQTIDAPLVLQPANATSAGTYTFSNAATPLSLGLKFGGTISPGTTTAGVTLTLTGASPSANNIISGAISNGAANAGLALVKSSSGTWTLSGANTFSGGITINEGTLKAGSNTALGSPTNNTVAFGSGSTGKLQLNGFNATLIGVNTVGTIATPVIENGAAATTSTLTDNTNSADTFGGVLQNGAAGTLALTKGGGGNLTLSGANTYTGATTVNSGKLLVTGSLASGSAVTVNGGTLGGAGTVAGSVTVNSGGTVAPGISPGILNTGSVTFASGSTFSVEIGGTTAGTGYDQLNVTGSVSPNGATLSLIQFGGFTPVAGNTFTIINNDDNADTITTTFAGLSEGATITNFLGSGLNATITYAGGTGSNDVVLTAVAVGHTISGTVFNDKGTTNIGTGKTVKLFVNGGSAATTTTNGAGQYSFSSVTFNAADVITVFISGATEKGATVTLAPNPVADITGLDIYRDSLIVRHETAGPITNANLDTGDPGDADLNAIYSVSGGALTVASGKELRVISGETYTPGANITTTDLFNAGILNAHAAAAPTLSLPPAR